MMYSDRLSDSICQKNEALREMMKKSYEILANHPINVERMKKGLNPANSIWFWGAGTRPALAPFVEKTGHTGAMISAVDLLKGIAVGADMKVVEVEGANGGLDTNYEGKADAAVEALLKDDLDFAYIHLEAPDEMGHQGSFERKVQAIENLDKRIIKRVTEQLEAAGTDFRMLVLPDHPTPVAIRTHVSDPVPYMLYDSTNKQSHTWNYNEKRRRKAAIISTKDIQSSINLFVKIIEKGSYIKMVKVVKFGGSSLASAEQFKKVGNIIRAEESRRYVVPSAPGKRFSEDTKVTDMLYKCYAEAEEGKNFDKSLKAIKERYNEIIKGLGLKLSLEEQFETIKKQFAAKAGKDYAASRGEYLNGIIMANYLGYEFIDAATVICFDEKW